MKKVITESYSKLSEFLKNSNSYIKQLLSQIIVILKKLKLPKTINTKISNYETWYVQKSRFVKKELSTNYQSIKVLLNKFNDRISKNNNIKIILELVLIIFSLYITAYVSYLVSLVYIGNTDATWMDFIVKHYNFGDNIHISSQTSILKFPFVYISNLILGYGFVANIFTNIVILCLTSFLIYLMIENLSSSKNFLNKITRITLFTLIFNASSEFFMFVGLNSARNLEFTIIVFILISISRLICKSKKYSTFDFILILFLSFVVTFSDQQIVILLLLPCICYVLIEFFKTKKINITTLKIFIPIILGILFSTIIINSQILNIFNIYFIDSSKYYFNLYTDFPKSIQNTFITLLSLFNTDFSGKAINIYSISSLVTFIITIIIFSKSTKYFLNQINYNNIIKSNQLTIFTVLLLITTWGTLTSYIFSNLSNITGTGKFLSFIVISNAIYFSLHFKTDEYHKLTRFIIIIVILSMVILNTQIISENFSKKFTDINYYDQLDKVIKDERLQFGYGGFWNSYSITLITNGHIPVLPVSNCLPYYLYNVDKMYVNSPDFIVKDLINDKLSWENCSDEDIEKLYGKITNRYHLLSNNHPIEILILEKNNL